MTRMERKDSDIADSRETIRKLLPHLEELVDTPNTAVIELFKLSARFVPPEDAGALTRILISHLGEADPKKIPASIPRHDLRDAGAKVIRHFYEYASEQDKLSPGTGEAKHTELLSFTENIRASLSNRTWVAQELDFLIEKIKAKGALLQAPPSSPPTEKSSVQTTTSVMQITKRKKPTLAGIGQDFKYMGNYMLRREKARWHHIVRSVGRTLRNAATGPHVPTRDKGPDTKSNKGPNPPQ